MNIKTDSSIVVQLTSTSCENNDFIEDKDSKPGKQTYFLHPMFLNQKLQTFHKGHPNRQIITHQPNHYASILTSIFLKFPHVLYACSHLSVKYIILYLIVDSLYTCIYYFLWF